MFDSYSFHDDQNLMKFHEDKFFNEFYLSINLDLVAYYMRIEINAIFVIVYGEMV